MSGHPRWPLERVLFVLAGTVTLLAAAVSPFGLLTAPVRVNQWLYVLAGACSASIVLRRAGRLRTAIYDHRGAEAAHATR